MNSIRSAVAAMTRAKGVLRQTKPTLWIQKFKRHEESPQPFDNMPFRITNRYVATAAWCIFFGSGLWAPFVIVWYSMAKRTL